MTNEEAIELLRTIEVCSFKDKSKKYFPKDVVEALDIAIKALEQQYTCDSCKYYTHRAGYRESKNYRYCNRRATMKMLPDDYCSRWEMKADDDRISDRDT